MRVSHSRHCSVFHHHCGTGSFTLWRSAEWVTARSYVGDAARGAEGAAFAMVVSFELGEGVSLIWISVMLRRSLSFHYLIDWERKIYECERRGLST